MQCRAVGVDCWTNSAKYTYYSGLSKPSRHAKQVLKHRSEVGDTSGGRERRTIAIPRAPERGRVSYSEDCYADTEEPKNPLNTESAQELHSSIHQDANP
eukprot:5789591-Amphidinium_carterae.1